MTELNRQGAKTPRRVEAPANLLALVTGLYLIQGLPFGIVNELVPVWLKSAGMSLEHLGLVTLVGLPWTLKALWAPVVDRHGRTGAWIAGALGIIAVGVAALPSLGPGVLAAAILVLVAAASATQDVAIDGWTATTVPEPLMGRMNGVRVAAYRTAMLVGGGGAVAVAGFFGWPAVFVTLAIVLLLYGVWARGFANPPREEKTQAFGPWVRELWRWLSRDGFVSAVGIAAFILLYKLGDAAMGPMVKPFWLDSGRRLEEVGLVSISLGTALSIAGAVVGGEIATRAGLVRALWALGFAQAASNLGYTGTALWPGTLTLYSASMLESFCAGLGTAAFLAALMRLCEGEQAATRFAFLTALAGLCRTIAGAVSGFGAEKLGYAGFFALTFALALPGLALVPVVARRLAVFTDSKAPPSRSSTTPRST